MTDLDLCSIFSCTKHKIFVQHLWIEKLLPPANKLWGKVMLLHVSVILFTGWAASKGGGSAYMRFCQLGGSTYGGLPPEEGLPLGGLLTGELGRPPEPEKRAVRILLECFLVLYIFFRYLDNEGK